MQVTSLPTSLTLLGEIVPCNTLNEKCKPRSSYISRRRVSKNSPSVPFQRKLKQKTIRPFLEEDLFPSSLPLHTRNPHVIYKDIQRFARQNKLKEALTILDYTDQQGIPINATTFSSLIAACVRSKSLCEGKQIHMHIRINGLEKNEFLATKLVHMYMACGSVEDAQKIFETCSSKTVYPYNAFIRGAVINGRQHYLDVVSTFSEMRELGVEGNVYTFSCMIKSFAGASALLEGLRTHGLLLKNGLIDSKLLRTTLMDMYFKCGKVKLARQVFDEFDERDVVVWGAMIAGLAHNRLQKEAIEYTRRMISEGIAPNSVILTTILPVIGELQARTLGQEVHAYVVKTRRYSEQLFIQCGLIDMYCKCRDMGAGRQVFYNSQKRSTVSWTALLSGYILNGRLEQALRSIVWMQQEGFRPDIVTIATVLPVCAELRDLRHGKEIHAYAVKDGFSDNVSIVTSLIVMYSKCRLLDYSLRLFEGMPQRNVICWTAMIDAYADGGYFFEALDVFRAMQLSNHRPDAVTLARLSKICAQFKHLKLGKEIHGQILKKNFDAVPFVSSEIIKMYGSCEVLHTAKLVFSSIPVKGSMTWTAIINAYGMNHMHRDAIDLFNQMISQGFTPNQFTFKVVLDICNQAGFADDALRVFNLMCFEYKIKAYGESYSLVVGLLERLGHFEETQRLKQIISSLI